MIVTLSGPDGVGKSTQLQLLLERARCCGWRASSMWYRPGYSDELDALRGLVRRIRPSVLPPPGRSSRREAVFAKRGVSEAWLAVAVVDACAQYGLRVRYLAAKNDLLICDRYVHDAILDIDLAFPNNVDLRSSARWALARCAPSPDVAILLVGDDVMLDCRARLKNEPFPDREDALKLRRSLYRALAGSGRFVVVDAGDDEQAVHRALWASVASHKRAPRVR